MTKIIIVLALLAGVAVPAKADCPWRWNGNGWQQICR
jgi:hypothetical protein